jgi:error-prone DNA polymerase
VYQSAYLKAHHPAPFFAALMQHRPGMYSQMTLEEEARRFGVEVRGPDIHRSGVRFDLEQADGDGARSEWAIRKPLASVKHVSADDAQEVVWARLDGPFSSVEDLYTRVAMDIDAFESLARAGALDEIAGSSRGALWEVGVLHQRLGAPGHSLAPTLFDQPVVGAEDRPDLPALTESERLSWDLQMHAAARRHPMTLLRRTLQDLEVRTVDTCYRFGRYVPLRSDGPPPRLTVAGLAILRQRPSTASGVTFLTIEDETGFIQCIVYPKVWAAYEHVLTAGHVIVRGPLQVDGNWRGLVVNEAWRLDGIFGGYEGHPSASGGRDRWIRTVQAESPKTGVASTDISPTDLSQNSPPEK